jgi:AcrR family transcriptional regulator
MQQDLKSEITKQLIIDESFNLFYEHGFKSTSIPKIMEATQLTKGAFYHHYKNKEEIGLKVIESKIQKRVVETMILPLQAEGNPLEILESIFIKRINAFPSFDKQHGCPLNNFINEIGDNEGPYQNALRNVIETWKDALIKLIDRGIAEKSIRNDVSSSATAIYLISAFEGIRGIRKLYQTDDVLNDYLQGLSHFLQQLKP